MRDRYFVGQRVRIIGSESGGDIGMLATVIGMPHATFDCATKKTAIRYPLDVDGHGTHHSAGVILAYLPEHLAPLGDDRAEFERFMARVTRPRETEPA